MNKKRVLSLLALALILIMNIPGVLAYFTGHDEADGTVPMHLGTTTRIKEEYKDWVKHVTILNEEGKPVYIRARAYVGQTYELSVSGSGWTDGGDGWWYYGEPVEAGKTTSALDVEILNIPEEDVDPTKTSFNVAVVYESTPVYYGEDGTAKPADWSQKLDVHTTTDNTSTAGGETNG